MQGVGNFVNTSVLIILLVIFQSAVPDHSNPQRPYAHHLCALPPIHPDLPPAIPGNHTLSSCSCLSSPQIPVEKTRAPAREHNSK